MTGKQYFRDISPFLQLLILCVLCLSFTVIFIGLGGLTLVGLYDINIFQDINILSDFSAPNVLEANRLILLFQHLGLFLVPAMMFGYLATRDPLGMMKLRQRVSGRWIAMSVLLMAAAQPLVGLLGTWNAGLKLPDSLAGLEATIRAAEDAASGLTHAILFNGSAKIFLINLLLLALVPALGEEMIFRGLVQPLMGKMTKNPHAAIWVTAFVFSFLHFQFYGFLPRLVLGAMLGYMFWWTGSLRASVAAHMVNNALGVSLYFLAAREVIPESWIEDDNLATGWLPAVASLVISFFLVRWLAGRRKEIVA
ncbi:MAG: CPBP family intramembrane metalloprotease [Flavobacteriales bacterium]|nr:CPBP family intramembrane metalloprotease [Flavobacteriales bacterium]